MSEPKPLLFVIDDEPGMLGLIARAVQTTGYAVAPHLSAREALSRLASEAPDVALVDLRMPELGGLDVLRAIREARPQCQVILMTAHASVETAIEAVKLGALDYLSKPLDFVRLRSLLAGVTDARDRRAALSAAEAETAKRLEFCGLIGRSAAMQELFDLVRRAAPHARAALVTGETGTGKEGIARAIHDLGPRKSRRILTINCSAVVETLFESELFGHVRGAFTGATDHKAGLFEAADGGTVFLDEVGELSAAVQSKLLRVLETGEVQRVGAVQGKQVDVRIVAATNRDLRADAEAGTFRSDLYYRLNVIELHIPPLRERAEDIPYLTASFIKEFAAKFRKPVDGVSYAAERALMKRAWLGNVRELRNVLERACMLVEGPVLEERDVEAAMPARTRADQMIGHADILPATSLTLSEDKDLVERTHILRVLDEEHGNKVSTAHRLGVSRRTLYRRLAEYQLLAAPNAGPGLSAAARQAVPGVARTVPILARGTAPPTVVDL
ncbi:MAG: sigma-54 dependent transcriptional regulator [Acidobacteriota bacterium]